MSVDCQRHDITVLGQHVPARPGASLAVYAIRSAKTPPVRPIRRAIRAPPHILLAAFPVAEPRLVVAPVSNHPGDGFFLLQASWGKAVYPGFYIATLITTLALPSVPTGEGYHSVQVVAQLYGKHHSTVRRWIKHGHLPAIQPAGKGGSLLIKPAEPTLGVEKESECLDPTSSRYTSESDETDQVSGLLSCGRRVEDVAIDLLQRWTASRRLKP
jgi:hypothetical protein